jgi:hypothetical protein
MDKLCKYIDKELDELETKIDRGGKLSGAEIEYGDKLAHFKKSLLTNEAMEDSYSVEYRGTSRRGHSEERMNDMSGARGRNARRDSMGRFSRDGFMDKLMEMKEAAPNERTRRAVEKMIDDLEN